MNTAKSNQELSNENFKLMVLENSNIALVKCKTEWSGSSRLTAPMFNELAKQYQDKINFFTIDAEKNKSTVEEYGVRELPHFLFFVKGELVDQVIGTAPKSLIEKKLQQLIQPN